MKFNLKQMKLANFHEKNFIMGDPTVDIAKHNQFVNLKVEYNFLELTFLTDLTDNLALQKDTTIATQKIFYDDVNIEVDGIRIFIEFKNGEKIVLQEIRDLYDQLKDFGDEVYMEFGNIVAKTDKNGKYLDFVPMQCNNFTHLKITKVGDLDITLNVRKIFTEDGAEISDFYHFYLPDVRDVLEKFDDLGNREVIIRKWNDKLFVFKEKF
ncbi:hypothetical protein KM792_10230 [Clostridium tyrobutyricum]|uniref:hypothetical protein n=1 Tax=Clostridium tyrobutyricum TaxID=1519 RepID=UPI001C38A653|nr:hypothetical protein [Clostridium tyrobutyricum]MBV4450029.1 hypothetical protein [Clostridium tyrobutyricum]